MKRTILALLLTATIASGDDSLEERLAKRDILPARPRDGQTLSQMLAKLSETYEARYHEALPIYIAVEIAHPPAKTEPKPDAPLPEIPGLVPIRDSEPMLGMPVTDAFRYYAGLWSVTFAIRGDVVLFQAKPK